MSWFHWIEREPHQYLINLGYGVIFELVLSVLRNCWSSRHNNLIWLLYYHRLTTAHCTVWVYNNLFCCNLVDSSSNVIMTYNATKYVEKECGSMTLYYTDSWTPLNSGSVPHKYQVLLLANVACNIIMVPISSVLHGHVYVLSRAHPERTWAVVLLSPAPGRAEGSWAKITFRRQRKT